MKISVHETRTSVINYYKFSDNSFTVVQTKMTFKFNIYSRAIAKDLISIDELNKIVKEMY